MFQILQQDHAKLKFGGKGSSYKRVKQQSNVFDNLDFKPKNEINNLTQLLDLI